MSNVGILEVAITSIKYGDVTAAAKELKIQYVGKSKSKIALEILEEVEKRLEYIPEGEEERSFSKELIVLYNHLVDSISVKEEEENNSLNSSSEDHTSESEILEEQKEEVVSTQEEIIGTLESCEERAEGVCIEVFLEEDKNLKSPDESSFIPVNLGTMIGLKPEDAVWPPDESEHGILGDPVTNENLPEENKTEKQQEVPKKQVSAYYRIKSLICEEILNGEVMWQTSKKKQVKRITDKLLAEGIISKNVNVILYDFYHSITVLNEYGLLKEDFPKDFEMQKIKH